MTTFARLQARARAQDARQARADLESAKAVERRKVMMYVRCALELGASWGEIGRSLGVTDTAARRYYCRHKEEE